MTDSNLQKFIDADQYLETSLSLYSSNKHEEAMALIDKAIECDPNFAEAYNRKGDCLFRLGRLKEALECYQKSHELNPNIQNNYFDLGRTYLALGDYDKALENFKTANSMRQQSDIHAFIGKIYFEQNKLSDAKASFENVLGLDKKAMDEEKSIFLAEKEEKEANPDGLFSMARSLIKKVGSSIANYYYSRLCGVDKHGEIFGGKLSDNEKSELKKVANNVINTAGNTMAIYYYAQVLDKEGQTGLAKEYFEKIISKFTMIATAKEDSAEAYYYIGKSNYFIGNYEKAIENLKKAIEYDTDKIYNHYSCEMFYSDADAFAALAEAQSKAGQTAEAKENIAKALELEPNNKVFIDLKAKLGY